MLREARFRYVVLLDVSRVHTDAKVAPRSCRQTIVSTDVQSLVDEVARVERALDNVLDGTVRGTENVRANRTLSIKAIRENCLRDSGTCNDQVIEQDPVVVGVNRQAREPLRIVDESVVERLAKFRTQGCRTQGVFGCELRAHDIAGDLTKDLGWYVVALASLVTRNADSACAWIDGHRCISERTRKQICWGRCPEHFRYGAAQQQILDRTILDRDFPVVCAAKV